MKKLHIAILLVILCTPFQGLAEETALSKIWTSANKTSMQVYITFDKTPKFTEVHKGKRIDIILDTNLTNTEPVKFQTDDKVVKFLTQEDEEGTILSFFMRYEPQRVEISTTDNTTLVLDILLGNQFTKAYPDLTDKLSGISVVAEKSVDITNPYVISEYSGNWRSFFSKYEPELKTTAPLKFSTTPFPIIDFLPSDFKSDFLSVKILELAIQEKWNEMIQIMAEQVSNSVDPEVKKHLALVLGEILLRAKNYPDAYRQLYVLHQKYDDFIGIGAGYLLAQLHAEMGSWYKAYLQFKNLDSAIHKDFALSPFILIGEIETALVTEKLDRLAELLQRDDVAFPGKLAKVKRLRQADYWYATNDYIKSIVGYQLLEDYELIGQYPYSMNGYCNTLYYQRKYTMAADCFDSLSLLVKEKEYLSLITLKKALAELHFKPKKEMYITFASIEDAFFDTPAGARAALKKNDIRYLTKPSFRKTSVDYYKRIAKKGLERSVAEEAALKEAIVHYELGNTATSIELLMQFLRNYNKSPLTIDAQALLIEQLPGQIKLLLDNDNYVDAIVLAKQNRTLFANNWIDISLLGMLAKAYSELGILDEARKLYLFLLNSSKQLEKEEIFLPLLTILHTQGYHELVEDYALQYVYNFPSGKDKDSIFLLRLKSLVTRNMGAQALELLSSNFPESQEVHEIASKIYFNNGDYKQTIEKLSPYSQKGLLKDEDLLYMLAESFYQENNKDEAERLFQEIQNNKKFFDHACYRLAMMARENGNNEKSLKLLQGIVEKGKDPLWQKLAKRHLEYQKLTKTNNF